MSSGFQTSGYQGNAYQIETTGGGTPPNNWLGGPKDDDNYWERVKLAIAEEETNKKALDDANKKLAREMAELAARKAELDELELEQSLEDQIAFLQQENANIIATQAMIAELQAQNALLQARIYRLRIEEEDALVILYSLPFVLN